MLTSIDGYEFVCWDQPSLAFLDNGTGNLGQAFQTTRKGIVIAGPANKVQTNVGDPTAGFSTLIGLVETNEGSVANAFTERNRQSRLQVADGRMAMWLRKSTHNTWQNLDYYIPLFGLIFR